jgi:hypothetical protein
MDTIRLEILGRNVHIDFASSTKLHAKNLVRQVYSAFVNRGDKPDWSYSVHPHNDGLGYSLVRASRLLRKAKSDGELIRELEHDITIELQKQRPDLYFLHGAALEFAGKGLALIGPSGSGKSTTTWELLNHGFSYLSDELIPLDLNTKTVYPYPHALCLKAEPTGDHRLPMASLRTSTTFYVPVEHLPTRIAAPLAHLDALFFIRYDPLVRTPQLKPITKAMAAARLFANALNPLAHENDGLDGAVDIVKTSECIDLVTGDLRTTCRLINELVIKNSQFLNEVSTEIIHGNRQ